MESRLIRGCVAAAMLAVLGGCGDAVSSEDREQAPDGVQAASSTSVTEAEPEAAEPVALLVAEVEEVVAVAGRGRQWKVVGRVRNDGSTQEHGAEVVVRLSSRVNNLPVATHAMDVKFDEGLSPGQAQAWEITLQLPRTSAEEVAAEAEVTALIADDPADAGDAWKPLVLPEA